MADAPEVDLVMELIGGSEGVARDVVERILAAGKPVITANKALMAHHGSQLARQAEAAGVALAYEAAVAGGSAARGASAPLGAARPVPQRMPRPSSPAPPT